MIGRISVTAIVVFIGACASSGPEAPPPAATASSAPAEAVAPDTASAAATAEIEGVDAPNVEQTASIAPEDNADETICRREQITGTRMSRLVCRKRSDIEASEANSQEALRGMRQSGSQLEKGAAN